MTETDEDRAEFLAEKQAKQDAENEHFAEKDDAAFEKEADDYCEGCKHLHYERDTDSWYCGADKKPMTDVDEGTPYCSNRDVGDEE